MSRERKVWVVSSGSYSDYRVLCACPDKKTAETVSAKMAAAGGWRSDTRVESLTLVTDDVERVSILWLSVNLWDDGTESDSVESFRYEWPFDALFDDAKPVHWRWVRTPFHLNSGGRLEVSGTDHERVRKAFSDHRGQIKSDDALRARKARGGAR